MDFGQVTSLLLVAPLICAVLIWILKNYWKDRTKQVPGLKPSHPINGNKDDIDAAGGTHLFLTKLHNKFGPIASFWMGKELTVSIASPKLFRQHEKLFDRPPQLFRKYRHVFGPTSVQFANKETGRRRRIPFDMAYAHQELSSYYPTFNEVIEKVADSWSKRPAGEQIALRKEIFAMSITAFTQATFGDYFKDELEVDRLDTSIEKLFHVADHNADGSLPEPGTPERADHDKANADVTDIIEKMVAHRKLNMSDQKIFLDQLMDAGLPDEQIQADARINFFGGYHTSALLIVYALYHLGQHQDIQEKAYKEICEVVGDDDIDSYACSGLNYVRRVLNETLRCDVVGTWAGRFDQDKDTELDGYTIKKSTPVIHALGVVLQDETIWPDPERFDPDRFDPEGVRSRPSLAFSPFGVGKRKCPGWRFGLAEATASVALILRKLKITTVTQSFTHVHRLLSVPDQEIYVTVERRS